MKPHKQTVYLPVDGKDCDFIVRWYDDSYENDVKREEGYFFTPEQLNEYTQNVIKQTLETAAENAETIDTYKTRWSGVNKEIFVEKDVYKESITNTFQKIFKKFEV